MAPSRSSAWLKSQSAARSTLPLHACGKVGHQRSHRGYDARRVHSLRHCIMPCVNLEGRWVLSLEVKVGMNRGFEARAEVESLGQGIVVTGKCGHARRCDISGKAPCSAFLSKY
jgi:hypothetical protein